MMSKTQSQDGLLTAMLGAGKRLRKNGIIRGSAGNFSLRAQLNASPGFWITPTGLDCTRITTADLVFLDHDGNFVDPTHKAPSSEWRIHRDILTARPEFGAIIHAHAPFATALACLGNDIPPFHYMIARFGGNTIRCATYAAFGSQALSDEALIALEDRSACLLANHGMIVCADHIDHAVDYAIELEDLCAQYWRACCIAPPQTLTEHQMAEVLQKFRSYGKANS